MTDERPDPLDQSIPLEERFPPASMTQDEWELAFENVKMDTPEQLMAALVALVKGPEGGHDYSTSGISMAIAARLAFNYVARHVGASGFQASYAALHAYGKIMHIDGPYGVVKAEDLLYPQHDLHAKLDGWIEKWRPWLKDQAQKKLDEHGGHYGDGTVAGQVLDHWRTLAAE